jgi:hypothetical protein
MVKEPAPRLAFRYAAKLAGDSRFSREPRAEKWAEVVGC